MVTSGSDSTPSAAPSHDLKLVLPGRRCLAGAGWTWIAQGWRLFTRAPLMWIIAIVIVLILAVVVSLVPFVGSLAFQLLNPVFAAGFVVACFSLERGGNFELEHLFAGFKSRFAKLLIVGLLYILGWIAIIMVFVAFAIVSIGTAALTGNMENILPALLESSLTIALGSLVALALAVPLVAAYWFAPALVIMHDLVPAKAMQESLFACLRNWIPFLVYGIIMLGFAIVAIIPFGLGFLVWVPLAVASTYAAYRDIFTEGMLGAAEA
ncbi:MAG TPA: BPSS1780 family membrane protein [Usitatibacter sp.]|nr:BPSS1780 family membrane protein [Usitatibacter sp.]